jgi:endonuclease-3
MGGRPRNSTPRQPTHASPTQAGSIATHLAEKWPDAVVELDHRDAYQLLVATILAAQSTDKLINTVTPALFAKYPDPSALAQADQAELEPMIFKTGFYRMKAKHLIGMAQAVVQRHAGIVPETMEELVALPGVARKTANVVLGNALGKHIGIVVDTHVTRLSARLGLTAQTDPVKIETELMALLPQEQWTSFGNRLIWHGRRVCHAKVPDCEHCGLSPICPSSTAGGRAPQIEVAKKPSRRAEFNKEQRAKQKPKAKAKIKARAGARS